MSTREECDTVSVASRETRDNDAVFYGPTWIPHILIPQI